MLLAKLSPEAWTAIAAWVAVLLAAVAGLVAFGQLREARRLRREQAQPYVVVFLDESAGGPWIGDFVIKNFGATAAYEVRLDASPTITTSLSDTGADGRDLLLPAVIPVLVPGQEWRTTWDSILNRKDKNLPDRFTVTVRFEDSQGEAETMRYVLDWEVYVQRGYVEQHGVHELVKSVRKIEKTMERWREPMGNGIRVVARDGAARDRKRGAQRKLEKLNYALESANGAARTRLLVRRWILVKVSYPIRSLAQR